LAPSFAVALGGLGVCLPIGLLIIGVLGLPLPPAVTYHLRIQRISPDLLSVIIGAAPPLAFRLVANPLLRSVRKVEKYVGNRGGGRSGSMRFLRNPEGSTLRTPKNKAGQFCLAITLREAFPMLAPAISVGGTPPSNLRLTLRR
jgi:hypothetical protein